MVNNFEIVFDSNEWEDSYNEPFEGGSQEYKFDLIIHSRITDERIPVILLKGNGENKMRQIREFIDMVPKNKFKRKIAIYGGVIGPEIKETVLKYGMKLYKKIVINQGNMAKIIEVPGTQFVDGYDKEIEKGYEKIQRREKIFIVKEILELLKINDSMNITKIIYRCNLNYRYAVTLLESLIKKGIVDNIEYKNGVKYRITREGLKYLEEIQQLYGI
jgi:predicted transcriptional regulator